MHDIIIIGAGMAGLTAAMYAGRAGLNALVLEKKTLGGQIVTSAKVANWPGQLEIPGVELMATLARQVSDSGVEVHYEDVETVVEVDNGASGSGRFIVKTDEGEYACNVVIIATGTGPRKLSKKQMASAGSRPISYCATCDGALYAGKPVVVVGSGNTAWHEAEYLGRIASKVYRIHHDDPIPEEAEAVFVAIGRVPETEIFRDLVELDEDGYIVAGEDCHTSHSYIFAAGDCRAKKLRQLVTAAADGAAAVAEAINCLE